MSVPAGRRNRTCEDRFYSPPAMRRQNQQHQQQQRKPEQLSSRVKYKSSKSSVESEKRIESNDDCASTATTTTSSFSSPRINIASSNLDMFMEHTTPIVNAQCFPKTSVKGWRTRDANLHPYFVLGDLWDSFKEWSAYGAGVPLVLNGTDSVVQYYVPYLSGIQLYIDPSKSTQRLRRAGEESDGESSRGGTSSDSSSVETNNLHQPPHSNLINTTTQNFNRLFVRNNYVTVGPAVDENDIRNPPSLLAFEYFEHVQPYSREPLSDKISMLASQFPELRTYRSCDLTSSSWVSVAWYPIYRIPIGQSLQNLDACFLTFHSLSTPLGGTSSERGHSDGLTVRETRNGELPLRLSLPVFGFAAYKFDHSVWSSSDGVEDSQKVSSLVQAADNWLRLLQVHHPDFTFFINRSPSR